MKTVLIVFVLLLFLKTAAEIILDLLNRQQVLRFSDKIPVGLEGVMDGETYEKAVAYTLAKNRFSIWSGLYGSGILALVILSGFLPWFYSVFNEAFGTALWADVLYLIAVSVVISLPGLPFEWWSQFRLEERFGFKDRK